MPLIRLFVASLILSPVIALAQQIPDGSMTYAPAGMAAVPISALALIPLGLMMAVFGVRSLKNGNGRKLAGLILAISGAVTFIGGVGYSQDSWAPIVTFLSNPAGDTVSVPADVHRGFENTSGVDQEITALIPPCDVPNTAPFDACMVGLVMPDQAMCVTAYICQ